MMERTELSRWLVAVVALALGLLTTVLGDSPAAAVPMAPATTGYTGAAYVYGACAQLSSSDTVLAGPRGSPERPGAASGVSPASVQDCGVAANTGPDVAQGFRSFSQAKRSLPSPGQGNVYDHVVEQSQIAASRSGFDPRLIHNPANLNPVPAAVNQAKANYYSSIRPFTGGQTVRNWLNGQTFGQQHSFGMDITSLIQRGGSLP